MRQLIMCLLLTLSMAALIAPEASAARFGGGKSFGVQRSHNAMHAPQKTARPAQQQSPANRWGSLLGGMLIGGLLASLFMGHGLGAGILSWLLVGGLVFAAYMLYKKFQGNPAFQSPQSHAFRQQAFNQSPSHDYGPVGGGETAGNYYPEGFDAESFIRAAKVTFIRLQAAYDQKNLKDIADFTEPDVYAEIKMQLDERGNAPNKTEVVSLEAELLDVSKQVNEIMASVKFTGFIKENNDPMLSLDEIWHFRQYPDRSNWVVAGIQQADGAL